MKYIFLFVVCFYSQFASSQACGPYIWSQSDIDNFNTNHPGCTVLSNLQIGDDATNLDSLYSVTKIEGIFFIPSNSSVDLSGLINLDSIIGYTHISGGSGMLPSLEYVGELFFQNTFIGMPQLNYIGANLNIDISSGNSGNFDNILNNLDSINGYFQANSSNDISEFSGFNNLKKVDYITMNHGSGRTIKGFNNLESLERLDIYNRDGSLTDCFQSLHTIDTYVKFDQISNVDFPLNALESVDRITLFNTDISSFNNLNTNLNITSELNVSNNNDLLNLEGLLPSHIDELEILRFNNNSNLTICDYDHICDLLSASIEFQLSNNENGCNSIGQLENRCAESGNPPVNDQCLNAVLLQMNTESECESSTTTFTTNSARMHQESFCVSDFGEEIFFTFTPTESMAYSITLSDYTKEMGMELYQGDCSDISLVQCGYNIINRYFKADSTYLISVFCDIPTEFTDFKICITETSLIGDLDGFGINVLSPLQDLHIDGAILIGDTDLDYAGTIRFNGTKFEGYNGFEWIRLDNGGNTIGFQDDSNSGQASQLKIAESTPDSVIENLIKENEDLKIRIKELEKKLDVLIKKD